MNSWGNKDMNAMGEYKDVEINILKSSGTHNYQVFRKWQEVISALGFMDCKPKDPQGYKAPLKNRQLWFHHEWQMNRTGLDDGESISSV